MTSRLKQCFSRLWRVESGLIVSTELLLMGTILTIGSIVGLTSIRDQLVQELADTSESLGQLNMSYSYAPLNSPNGRVAGSRYNDRRDFCQATLSDDSPPLLSSVRVGVQVAPSGPNGE